MNKNLLLFVGVLVLVGIGVYVGVADPELVGRMVDAIIATGSAPQ